MIVSEPEVPVSQPTVMMQIDDVELTEADKVDILLVVGGINDVGVNTILSIDRRVGEGA
jgi:hypothetical protein